MADSLIDSLWVAIALMLVIEGVIPFLSPDSFRRTLLKVTLMNDRQLRIVGLISMLLGLALLYWIR